MNRRFVWCLGSAVMIGTMVNAQPVLTYADDAPLADTHFLVFSGPALDPGPAGANAVYDLEDFTAADTAWTHFYANTGTPFGCPGLDTMNLTGDGICLRLVDTALYGYHCGYYVGTLPMVGIGARTLMQYPFTFGDAVQDNWGDLLLTGNCSGVDVFYSDTLEADGYGSLLTPFGTFGPVLRVHTTTTFAFDTVRIQESYQYFLPGVRYPVAKIDVSGSVGSAWTTRLLDPTTVGLQDLTGSDPAPVLFPVPALDRLHWKRAEGDPAFGRLLIKDTQGREVGSYHPNEVKDGMDVRDLAPGIYTLFEEAKAKHSFIGRFTKQ